jgi:8-amino-7-oxononanoate synthase
MVDDAHGFGVLGQQGGGCAEHFQLSQEQLPILIGTLGKAFGTFGAFVAGSEALIETLIQFARPYIYTTALPPAIAAATLQSLNIIELEKWRREQLQDRIQQFKNAAENLGFPLMPSITPIQPMVLGEDKIVLDVAEKLKEKNILVGAIRPPTVPEGTARLRITFSANHTEDDVENLLLALDASIPMTVRQ